MKSGLLAEKYSIESSFPQRDSKEGEDVKD
jgi:hypothetical protein